MKRQRKVLLGGAIAVGLLVAAIAALAALVPADRVAAAVSTRAAAAVGQRIRIEGVGVRAFPRPAIRLSGVALGGAEGGPPAAVAERVELRPRLLPLLRGEVVVDRLALDAPRILLDVGPDGRLNLALASDSTREAPARDVRFSIAGIEVNDGRIAYRDRRDGTVVRLDGWNQRLRLEGEVRAGELATVALEGWLSVDDVDARVPGVVLPPRDLRVRIDHDATLDRAADRLELRSLDLALDGVELSGSGRVDSVSSATGRTAELALAAADLDAGSLLDWLPDDLRDRLALADGRQIGLEGRADAALRVSGPVGPDTLPDFHGTLTVRDGVVDLDGERLMEGLRGEAAFSADSAVTRWSGRALGEPFSAGVALREPAAPVVVAALDGRVDLRRLAALGLVADSLGLEGAVTADIQARVPLEDRARSQASGELELVGVRVAGLAVPVAVGRTTVALQGERIRAEPVPLALGPDGVPVTVNAAAEGWIPALVDSAAPPPRVVAVVRADSLDLDALLGPSESEYPPLLFARLRDRPLDGRTAAEVAEAAGLALPDLPRVDAEIRTLVRRLVRNGLVYSDVDATVALRPGSLDLEVARFGLMGGRVELTGRYEPTRRDSAGRTVEARVLGQYSLGDVGARPFFDRLTPFRDHLDGDLALAGTFGMSLDRNALPVRSSVASDGTIAIRNGRLSNWTVLEAASGRLGLTAFDTLRFRDWAGSFGITGPLVALEETVLDGPSLAARAAGSFDFGGALDLGASLLLAPDLARRAGSLGDRAAALASSDGRVPVGLRITGTVESPSVTLDLSEARTAVVNRAREAARQEATQLAERAAREAVDRLELPDSLRGLSPDSLRAVLGDSAFALLPDSLKLRGDSLRAEAESALKARLRRLLPGGGGGP